MNSYLEERLSVFLRTRLEPFYLKQLLHFIGEPVNPIMLQDLSGFLVFNQLAFLEPLGRSGKDLWISRAGLFTGKPIVLVPTHEEIVSGVLIPGSRLIPFFSTSLLPHELSFTFKGKKLDKVRLEVSSSEIYRHYSLFGDEYTPQYLALDNEDNLALFGPDVAADPPLFSITVADMREIYWTSGFKPGDRIVATLTDWAKGEFELEILAAGDLDKKQHSKWLIDMEDALVNCFDINGPGSSIDEQLAFAWFIGQDNLFIRHAASMEEFFKWTKRIAVQEYGVETRLWLSGKDIESQEAWNIQLLAVPGSMTEEAFMHLGLPLTDHLMDSYIMDALYRGETDISALLDRIIPQAFPNGAFCIPIITRTLAIRFREEQQRYNRFADHEIGIIRNRYIELHNGMMHFLAMLYQSGIPAAKMPEQGSIILGQLMSHCVSALEGIDFGCEEDAEGDESLWASIEGMEDSFFDIKTVIQEALPDLNKSRFRIIKKKEKPDE